MPVSSVSSGSSIYGSRNANIMSGLASGMDTESMIEGMVQGLKSKVDKQKQNQQVLLWQQEAYRSITDKLVALSSKYTSYSSSTNLMSSAFFSPSIVTPQGTNADKLSASGTSNSDIRVESVSQLAQNESIAFTGLNGVTGVSNTTVSASTGVDLMGKVDISNIAGKSLSFKYGDTSFSVTFSADREYKSTADVVDEFNKRLKDASIKFSNGNSVSADTVLQAVDNEGKFSIELKNKNDNNTLSIADSSNSSLLDSLFLSKGDMISTGSGKIEGTRAVSLTTSTNTSDVLSGASMSFSFNGTTATIRLPQKGTEEYDKIFKSDDPAKAMQEYMQTQIDRAFGYNRIKVGNAASDGKFQPTFEVKEGDVFSVTGGSANLIGKGGIFGIELGASNRVNVNQTLGDLYGEEMGGLKAIQDENGQDKVDKYGNKLYALEINGVKIGEYTKETTLSTIMQDIGRNTDAGAKVTYSATSNQFVMTSTHGGAGGRLEIKDNDNSNLAAKLFGTVEYGEGGTPTIKRDENAVEAHYTQGQDAKMTVTINGTKTELTSGTNTFSVDGMTITANDTFEAQAGGSVSFTSSVDTDKIVNAIKEFVDDYNAIIDEVGTAYTSRPDKKGYLPLTDDQKKDMTEKQIEEYEAKAKQGLLYGDRDLNGLSNGLRFLFSNENMRQIGITTSTNYSDKGKIALDETKLRSILASDPTKVQEAFTNPVEYRTDDEGNTTTSVDTSTSGVMGLLKQQLDKYARTSGAVKGILVQKAGTQFSALSLLQNSLQTKIDDIDDTIDRLNSQLSDRIDYYTSKFSKLEVLIAQMNSQSSYLAGMGGGGY